MVANKKTDKKLVVKWPEKLLSGPEEEIQSAWIAGDMVNDLPTASVGRPPKMVVGNRIFRELVQTKLNIDCLALYTDRVRRYARYANAAIILFASFGTIGGLFLREWIAIATSALVAVSTILKSLLPNYIQSEQDLRELDKLMDFYNLYLVKLEWIWYEHDKDIVDEGTSLKKLLELKETECCQQSAMNRGVQSITKREKAKMEKIAENYFNGVSKEKEDEK